MTEICKEQVDRSGNSRWPMFQDCGRKAVICEVGKSLKNEWHCKLHSNDTATRRAQRNSDRYEEKMAPRYYQWAAVAYCRKLGLTLEQLKLATQEDAGVV